MSGGNGLSRYRLVVSQELSDLEWDDFVAAAVGGAYQQTSMWAEVKATLGWRCARLVLRGSQGIVAGCQVLLRPVPWLGAIAYASRAPLVAGHDPRALESLLEALHELALQERILYLKVQPPPGRGDMAVVLGARGFVESTLDVAPAVTVRVDLDRSPEALLAAMRRNTRTNIRKAQRLGVQIREGGEADLGTFMRLLGATARRRDSPPIPGRTTSRCGARSRPEATRACSLPSTTAWRSPATSSSGTGTARSTRRAAGRDRAATSGRTSCCTGPACNGDGREGTITTISKASSGRSAGRSSAGTPGPLHQRGGELQARLRRRRDGLPRNLRPRIPAAGQRAPPLRAAARPADAPRAPSARHTVEDPTEGVIA
jgi:hypothetical protein